MLKITEKTCKGDIYKPRIGNPVSQVSETPLHSANKIVGEFLRNSKKYHTWYKLCSDISPGTNAQVDSCRGNNNIFPNHSTVAAKKNATLNFLQISQQQNIGSL